MSKKTYVDERREFDLAVFGDNSKWNFCYITPEEYLGIGKDSRARTLKQLQFLAKKADKGNEICDVCENDTVWQLVDLGMCFSCTTGETDRSEDLELTMDKNKQPHYK